jgi:GDP-mannose 6-dehydrogenase
LEFVSSDIGANTTLIDAVNRSNDVHKHFLFQYCVRQLSPPARILLVGLAFKRGTDDLRESPAVDLARRLLNAGYNLSVYDPTVESSRLIGQNLGYAAVHLPNINSLLATRATVQKTNYDLVIDTNGESNQLKLTTTKIISIDTLP